MSNGTVHASLLQDTVSAGADGPKWVWAVVHVDSDGTPEILSMGHPNCDSAKSAAWEAAQRLGAVTVSTKRRVK